ncbi:MAG TPA: hypothetical protein VGJ07_09585 [Rugosimonospora sp.]
MYRLLVRLYPAAHRRAFGEQMVQTFGDHYRDAVEARGGSRLRFWVAVLADGGTSLLTEHTAELRALWRRGRRQAATPQRRRGRLTRREGHRRVATRRRWAPGPGAIPGAMTRRRRVRLRLRYRPSVGRSARVLVRSRHHQLVYRGRIAALAVTVALIAAALGAGTATRHLGMSVLVTGLFMAAWLGYGMRLDRRIPAGPHWDGPAPPGGAGVREPLRPLPLSPAGSAARPMPDQDPPGQAAALI